MLYISKQVGRLKWGVIDTEDGVEEIVSYYDLLDCIINLGLVVEGVHVNKCNKNNKYSLTITPYMNESCSKYAKLSILYGVDMTVSNNCLTRLVLNSNAKDCTIVLSNYCDSIADYAIHTTYSNNNCKIILVLDNKLNIAKKAFNNLTSYGNVYIDVSELTDEKILYNIYNNALGNYVIIDYDINKFRIIDSNELRLYYHLALHVLTHGLTYSSDITYADQFIPSDYLYDINYLLIKFLSKDFDKLSKCSFYWNENNYLAKTNLIKFKLKVINNLGFNINSNSALDNKFLSNNTTVKTIMSTLKKCFTINSVVCNRLECYIRLFNKCDRFLSIYLDLAKRFILFLREDTLGL